MGIIQFFLICLVIGFLVWLIQTYAPIPPIFKQIVLWAGVIVIVMILLSALGVLDRDWVIPRIGGR